MLLTKQELKDLAEKFEYPNERDANEYDIVIVILIREIISLNDELSMLRRRTGA